MLSIYPILLIQNSLHLRRREHGKAFHISYNADEDAREIAREMNLELIIHDREKMPIIYREMPSILSRYEYYIDIKRDNRGKILYTLRPR